MTSHFQMLMTLQFCRVKISFLPDLCLGCVNLKNYNQQVLNHEGAIKVGFSILCSYPLLTNFHNCYCLLARTYLVLHHGGNNWNNTRDEQHMITREVKTQNTCRPAFPPRHWWPRKPMEEGTNTYPGTHQQPPIHSFNNYGLQRPTKRMPCYFYDILIKIASLLVDHIRPEIFGLMIDI